MNMKKIVFYKLLNYLSISGVGILVVSFIQLLRGENINTNFMFSLLVVFSLVSFSISLGETMKLKREGLEILEENVTLNKKQIALFVIIYSIILAWFFNL